MLATVLVFAFHLPYLHGPPKRPPPVVNAHGHYHHWDWRVRQDRFSNRFTCEFNGPGMHLRSQSLIFALGHRVETTHAFYRVDARPPDIVSNQFIALHKLNIFPERGWIDDRDGGEVALPMATIGDGKKVWIRANSRSNVRYYDLSRMPVALQQMRKAGCPDYLP
jgi:hypothetical protein